MRFMYQSVFSMFSATIKTLVELFKTSKISQISTLTSEYKAIQSKVKDLYNTNLDIGLYHLHKGNLNDALFRFWMIEKFKPNVSLVQYNIGRCYLMKGKEEKALVYLKKAVQIDPNNIEALYQIHKLSENYNKIDQVPLQLIREHFDHAAGSFANSLISSKYLGPQLVYSGIEKYFERHEFFELNILDLGCGTGICSQFLKMLGVGASFVGVDASERMISLSKRCKVGEKNVFDIVSNADIDEFLNKGIVIAYDVIILSEVLQYRKDLTSILTKASEALSKSGIIIIVVRAASSWDLEFSKAGDCFMFSGQFIKEEIESANLNPLLVTKCKIYESSLDGIFAIAGHEERSSQIPSKYEGTPKDN